MPNTNSYLKERKPIKRPFSLALPLVCVIACCILLTIDPMLPARGAMMQAALHELPTVSAQPVSATDRVTIPTVTPAVPLPVGGVPAISGQLILVSESQQWLWVYQDRQLVYNTPITTGRPGLTTPTGIFHVLSKATNLTFYSPWAPSSPNYYTPEHVNFAMFFRNTGFYIHDAPWRAEFGPGSNVAHVTTTGTSETGSHGCVNVPTSAGAWIYHWASIGTTIDIVS